MKNKGFTLIELLAVIVILAIIALIATPIVTNIINDSRRGAAERGAENYVKQIENTVANSYMNPTKKILDGTYKIDSDGNLCSESSNLDDNGKCPVESIIKIDMSGTKPSSGKVVIQNGKVVAGSNQNKTLFTINEYNLELDANGKIIAGSSLTPFNPLTQICELKSGISKEIGSKYECEVKQGVKYTFYVLSSNADGTINLIMDQNINSDGSSAGTSGVKKEGDNVYNLMAWQSSNNNADGPITVMQFLYNATKGWTKLPTINYSYKDLENPDGPNGTNGYTSFISINGVAVITSATGTLTTIGSASEPLRARLPIYSSNSSITELLSNANAPYLYGNLNSSYSTPPLGYWSASSFSLNSTGVWHVDKNGLVQSAYVGANGEFYCGVRPVITLSESQIQ